MGGVMGRVRARAVPVGQRFGAARFGFCVRVRRDGRQKIRAMCRNIKPLFNFDPPVTDDEIRAASLQFVRKVTGFNKPSKANEAAFLSAVDEVARAAAKLLHALETIAPPKNPEEEAAKARARSRRFAPVDASVQSE